MDRDAGSRAEHGLSAVVRRGGFGGAPSMAERGRCLISSTLSLSNDNLLKGGANPLPKE